MQINKVNTVTCTTDMQDGHKSGTVRSLWSQPILHGANRVFSDDHPHLLAQRCGPMHSCWPLSTKAVVLVQCNPLVPCCKTLAAASCMLGQQACTQQSWLMLAQQAVMLTMAICTAVEKLATKTVLLVQCNTLVLRYKTLAWVNASHDQPERYAALHAHDWDHCQL